MKTVLIIGFFWPYLSGSKRVFGLAKYLEDHDWSPVVITPPLLEQAPSRFHVLTTGYRGFARPLARLFGFNQSFDTGDQFKAKVQNHPQIAKAILKKGYHLLKEVFAYPDEYKGWLDPALVAIEDFMKTHPVDAVISVWPTTSHLIAQRLKRRHGVRWIADLADLWSDNSAYPFGKIRKWFDEKLEKKTLADADAITTSSEPLADRLKPLHPGKKIASILIGFDNEEINDPALPLTNDFTITYTGMFYQGKRDPGIFLKALRSCIDAGGVDPARLQVNFYGPPEHWVEQAIAGQHLENVVHQRGMIPLKECLVKQRKSQILLHINWSDPEEKGVFSGKFLDYMAARRPVLAAGGAGQDEVIKKMLSVTRAGFYAPTEPEIVKALQECYRQFEKEGRVDYAGSVDQTLQFSNSAMSKRFADILNSFF